MGSLLSKVLEGLIVGAVTKMKRGDTSPSFVAKLLNEDGTVFLLTGATVVITLFDKRTRERILNTSATVTGALTGEVTYVWQVGDLNRVGDYDLQLEVTLPTGKIQTFPSDGAHPFMVQPAAGGASDPAVPSTVPIEANENDLQHFFASGVW